MKKIQLSLILFSTFLFMACGGHENSSHDAHTDQADTQPSAETESGVAVMIAAPEGARVFFGNLEDGAVVTSPVKIMMGSEGISVKPAGEIVEGSGHHHIIINEGSSPYGEVVGADDTHIHYGKGQEETELELTPGSYTITLQFADGFHRSYGEGMSTTISIEVQ